MFGQTSRILKIGGFVFDRKSIDVLTQSIRKASEIWLLVKTPKIGTFVVDRNSIDLYYKIGGFVVDRKSIDLIDLLTKKCDWHRGKGISMRL